MNIPFLLSVEVAASTMKTEIYDPLSQMFQNFIRNDV
jgi:hypothetical protein